MKVLQKYSTSPETMSQMKFISDAESAVEDALTGLKCSYPALYVDKKNRIVLSNQVRKYFALWGQVRGLTLSEF